MTGAQPTSRKRTRWSCDHTNHVIANEIGVVSTAKQHQTRHKNARATGVKKRPDRNRERGLTSPSNRAQTTVTTANDCIVGVRTGCCQRVLATGVVMVPLRVLPFTICTHATSGQHCTLLFSTSTSVQRQSIIDDYHAVTVRYLRSTGGSCLGYHVSNCYCSNYAEI
jgi:hypothetical protein